MAVNKNDEFTSSDVELAKIGKAFAHPARVKILQILSECNSCICGDIVDLLPLSQSTVSQHLKELKNAGLIKGEIEGPRTCYCLNEEQLKKAGIIYKDFFDKINKERK